MKSRCSGGFALPSVLIASIIMLTVLLAAITSTAAVRTSLLSQYYNQLSRDAGDAGIVYAKACLATNGGVPLWTDAKPLMPNTDCTGTQLAGFTCPAGSLDSRCLVMINGNVKSSFSVSMPDVDIDGKSATLHAVGTVGLLRTSDNSVWRNYTQNTIAQTNFSGIGIVANGLVMNLDATNPISYPGSGTTWTDLSGNGNNGTLVNGVGYTSANGGALTFDGVSNYVNVPNSSSILPSTGNISTLACFKALAVGTDGGSIIFNKEDEYELSAGGGNIDYAFRPNWAWVGQTAFNVSQFYCVAVTYDQSYQRMYINGTPVYSAPLSGAIGNLFSKDLRIGARSAPGAASGFFNGQIATVQIYNRALSATEVQQNFDALEGRYDYQYAKVLVVAGGGGSGGNGGGGGGGGGVVNSPIAVFSGTYAITVGVGVGGGNGGNSIFSGVTGTITAIGGGAGGSRDSDFNGHLGGSGGGGGGAGSATSPGAGTSGQGNAGGSGYAGGGNAGPGGGGGAGSAGANGGDTIGGNGGNGVVSSVSGSSVYYGGGGGGGLVGGFYGTPGIGGLGGGGNGASLGNTGWNGVANTGGGAGGNANTGGSGIVIVSYPTNFMIASGGTITYSGGNTVHTFTSSGTFTVLSKAPRNQNIMPGFASWTLSGGATYNSSTGQLTLGASGVALSPLIRVDKPTMMYLGGDFYSTAASVNCTPKSCWHSGSDYFAANGVTAAYNWWNYAGNGCANSFALSTWDVNDTRCNSAGGPNVVYARFNLVGSNSGYASTDLIIKNPRLTLTD